MNQPKGNWLYTDLEQEAISALEMVYEQLGHIQVDTYRWKWVIIALHNSVQNFMLLGLRGTNNVNVMKPKDARAWIQAYDNNTNLPAGELDYFLELYKKIKGKQMLIWSNSQKFVPQGQHGRSIKRLNIYESVE